MIWMHTIFMIAVNGRGDLEEQEVEIADQSEMLAWCTWRWGQVIKWPTVGLTCRSAWKVLRAPFRLLRHSLRDWIAAVVVDWRLERKCKRVTRGTKSCPCCGWWTRQDRDEETRCGWCDCQGLCADCIYVGDREEMSCLRCLSREDVPLKKRGLRDLLWLNEGARAQVIRNVRSLTKEERIATLWAWQRAASERRQRRRSRPRAVRVHDFSSDPGCRELCGYCGIERCMKELGHPQRIDCSPHICVQCFTQWGMDGDSDDEHQQEQPLWWRAYAESRGDQCEGCGFLWSPETWAYRCLNCAGCCCSIWCVLEHQPNCPMLTAQTIGGERPAPNVRLPVREELSQVTLVTGGMEYGVVGMQRGAEEAEEPAQLQRRTTLCLDATRILVDMGSSSWATVWSAADGRHYFWNQRSGATTWDVQEPRGWKWITARAPMGPGPRAPWLRDAGGRLDAGAPPSGALTENRRALAATTWTGVCEEECWLCVQYEERWVRRCRCSGADSHREHICNECVHETEHWLLEDPMEGRGLRAQEEPGMPMERGDHGAPGSAGEWRWVHGRWRRRSAGVANPWRRVQLASSTRAGDEVPVLGESLPPARVPAGSLTEPGTQAANAEAQRSDGHGNSVELAPGRQGGLGPREVWV